MSIFITINPVPQGEGNYSFNWENSLYLDINAVMDGTNRTYSGGQIQIRERLKINTFVEQPSWVDVDYNWPRPHEYLGNYQIAGREGFFTSNYGDEGYITNTETVVEKITIVNIVADSNKATTVSGVTSIEQCNLRLLPELKVIPPVITPVLTYVPERTQPNFVGLTSVSPPAIRDGRILAQISGVLVRPRAGVAVINATYGAEVINEVFNDDPIFEQPICKLPENPTCDAEFTQFLYGSNGGIPPGDPSGVVFTDLAQCQAIYPPGNPATPQCALGQFTCTSGEIREYVIVLAQ